jgi:uncharacterized protein YggE
MLGVFVALRTAGITDADIGTTGFNVSPVFDVRAPVTTGAAHRCVPREQYGDDVGAEYGRSWRDVGCVNKGRSEHIAWRLISSLTRMKQCRAGCVLERSKDAQRKAATMAEAPSARLSRVVSISEIGHGGGPTPAGFRTEALASMPVSAWTSTLSMDLAVVFELR